MTSSADMTSNQNVSNLCSVEPSDRMLANSSVSVMATHLTDSSQVFDLPLIGSSDISRITADLFVNIGPDSGSVTNLPDMSSLTVGPDFGHIDSANHLTLFQANDPNISQTLLSSNIFATNESISYDLQNSGPDISQLVINSGQSLINNQTKSSLTDRKPSPEQKPKPLTKKKAKPLTTQIIPVLDDEELVNELNASTDSDYLKIGTLLNCKYCGFEATRLQEIRRHLKIHTEDKPFKCTECDQSFNFEINLRIHCCGHHYKPNDDLKAKCCECDKRFTRLASLKSHLTTHQKEELLSCGQCSQQFPTQYYLNKHITSDHLNCQKRSKLDKCPTLPKIEHICNVCSQKFANNSLLKEHQKLHIKISTSLKHKTYKKWIDRSDFRHKCLTCGKAFKKNSQLIRHNRIHSGEKPFVCEICGSAFNQKSSLDIHRTKHTGERKHQCNFCGAQFNQSGNMRSHIKRLHAPQADTPHSQLFKCPFCSCVFKKLGILNCHISRRHPLEANTNAAVNENKGPIGSSLLNISDERLNDLLNKVLEKSGVKANGEDNSGKQIAQLFDPATGTRQTHIVRRVGKISYRQCLYCQKEFKKSSDLVRHYRIHTHDKPFKCSQCYRAFTVKGTLSAHMRTHNGLKPYVCQICNKSFSTSQSLKVHLRLHTGALPYHCKQCDKSFRTLGHLKTHTAVHHMKSNQHSTSDSSTKPFRIRRKDIDKSLLENIHLDGPLLLVNSTDNVSNEANTDQNQLKRDETRKHKCCHCGKGFKKSSHLTQHIRSHTGEKPYQCNQCLQCFVAKGSLKIHMQVHSKVKPYKCSECQFAFATRGSLSRHMIRHTNNRPYMCPYCSKTFKSSLNCKKHIKLHRTEFAIQLMTQQKIESQQMSDNQKENQSIEVNEQKVVSIEDNSVKAMQTIDRTQNQMPLTEANNETNELFSNIDYNLSTVDNQAIQQTVVNAMIPQSIESLNEQNLHNSVGVDPSRPHLCQVCGVAFKKQAHLRQHERRHTGERPFKCEICGRSFSTRGVLNSHINTHSGTKNFRCDVCQSTFVTNNSLRRHLKTVHTYYTCPQCATKFKSQSALEKHLQSVHNMVIQAFDPSLNQIVIQSLPILESCPQNSMAIQQIQSTDAMIQMEPTINSQNLVLTEDENKPIVEREPKSVHQNKCDFCPKSFKKPSDLQRHRRIHTGEKPFVCHICSKSFTVKSTLDCHIQTHDGLKNFKCDICGTSFATNGSLKVHIRLHTGQKPFECDICGEKFRTSGHRKSHIEKHNKTKVSPQIQTTISSQVNPSVNAIQSQPEIQSDSDVNQILESDVLRIAVNTSGGQTANTFQLDGTILSQLLSDPNVLQQLQSQGFIITETDSIDLNGESLTTLTTNQLF